MKTIDLLDTELQTYQKNREHLLETSQGQFVLIHGEEVAAVFASKVDAIAEGFKRFGNVPFLVKEIVEIEVPVNFTSHILGI